MSHNPCRVSSAQRNRRVRSRRSRWALTGLVSLGLVSTAAGCGMNVQTTNPYTPAIGVNFDAGDVQVRNLMILSRAKGNGFLSGTFTANGKDSLVAVSGTATKSDGSDGAPLVVSLGTPVMVSTVKPVVLTKRPLVMVKSADIQPGLTARMLLRFSKAGEVTSNVPVVDATLPQYATIKPTPAP